LKTKVGKVINLRDRLPKKEDNLVSSRPWEFRRAEWETLYFVQMLRPQSVRLEQHPDDICGLPPHFLLKGGMASTIRAIYACREDENKMREIYYLVGLMDCMVNQVNAVLRTDLLRAMYKKVFTMKEELNVHWYNSLDQVLLPIDYKFYNAFAYQASLKNASTMEGLYRAIRRGTDEMFDILSLEYVFYCPGTGG
jgi:hypothetical protein